MNEDQLEMLLQQADAAIGTRPRGPEDLASRVRRHAGRRRQVMLAGATAAAVLALVVGALAIVHQTNKPVPVGKAVMADAKRQPVPLADLQASVQQLSDEVLAECKVTQEVARQEDFERRLAELQERAAADPVQEVNDQVERAALTIVYQADRMYRELNLRESAIASYKQTIEFFPHTHWAKVAKDRLAEIQAAGQGDAS
jgi:hypothetical protein